MKKLSIIMPVYNEKAFIKKAIAAVLSANIGKLSKEVIVVDDGSRDGTTEILKTIKNKKVKVFFQKKNQGKGAAIRLGLTKVTGKTVPVVMGDRRAGDPATLVASSEKAKTELGWVPKYPEIDQIITSAWEAEVNPPKLKA